MERKEVEIGKSYAYRWPNRTAVAEYVVTDIAPKTYGVIWSDGVPLTLRFGSPINLGSAEFDTSDFPVLMCDDEWLDLKIGHSAFISGKLTGMIHPISRSFTVEDDAGNGVTIDIMVPFNGPHTKITGPVKVRIIRTENGLETHPGWIVADG